jgi:hypothetical protein
MKNVATCIIVIALSVGLAGCSASSGADEPDPAIDSQQTMQDESSGNQKVANAAADVQESAESFRITSKETLAEMKRDLDQLGNTVDAKTSQVEDDADEGAEKLEKSTETALKESNKSTEAVQESAEDSTDSRLASLRADIDALESKIEGAKFETREEYETFAAEVKKESQEIQAKLEKLRKESDGELKKAVAPDAPSGDS